MKRDNKLEVLRVISTVLVIMVHVANYYTRRTARLSPISYLGALTYNVIARVSVPVFFMISGVPLLSKPYNREKNKKRIIKRGISLVGITFVYLLWDKYFMGKKISVFPPSRDLINQPERALLWFMYALLGIYIALPFIKGMVDSMGEREDRLFIILWLAFTELKRKGYVRAYPVPIISGTYYLGYFMIGYILVKYKDKIDYKKYTPHLAALALASTGYVIFTSYRRYLATGKHYTTLLTYSNIYSMVTALRVFLLIYAWASDKESKVINKLSYLSFGIYLFHGLVLDVIMKAVPYTNINCFIGRPCLVAVILAVTCVIVSVVKKIKFIGDYI